MPIRIVLADDHAILRQGLKLLFANAGITVVGEAADGAEAVKLARDLHPQVVVLDLAMPNMNGIDAATQIRQDLGIPCILLTMHAEDHYVLRALSLGIAGYVLKFNAAREVVQAVNEVVRGNVYLSPGISGIVVREMLNKDTAREELLTLRERQVVQLIAEGNSTKEVSSQIGVSVRTGESHRARIMEKLDIHETAGLVRYAIRQGLTQP